MAFTFCIFIQPDMTPNFIMQANMPPDVQENVVIQRDNNVFVVMHLIL
jgi:hypothetical protein